ncbi:DUF6473 family protein [Croceicoccus marinus]|uniref:DUF6473 domain-containing protein n=1 Tax=Croceicoccus marinus TaxID=450378 RepID=A0A7G6VUS7_9SPHN|nr:DUF6473 family protein [Croceicoccus marinus]QNE05492.1 hypothetical protein H4O24_01965 [Croceicoccus marinus]
MDRATEAGGGRTMGGEHLSGYQARDYAVVDYHMYRDARTGLSFRGPEPSVDEGNYVTCPGAAQAFGCFCDDPFPDLLAERLDVPFVNLGYGGAGPAFFLRYPQLIEFANRGRAVILQVTSGRSESNSVYDSGGLEYVTRRADGQRMSAQQAWAELLAAEPPPAAMPRPLAKAWRMFVGPPHARKVLAETRANWIAHNRELMERINVPVVYLYFSRRAPAWHSTGRFAWWWQRYDSENALFGDYPQLVNQRMLDATRGAADDYVHCHSRRGSPQPLTDRSTGQPARIDNGADRKDLAAGTYSQNDYYPSPEMHLDAADLLEPVLRRHLRAAA